MKFLLQVFWCLLLVLLFVYSYSPGTYVLPRMALLDVGEYSLWCPRASYLPSENLFP